MALLDLDNANPWSRLQRSEYRTLEGLRQYVDRFVKTERCARACVGCCMWLCVRLWLCGCGCVPVAVAVAVAVVVAVAVAVLRAWEVLCPSLTPTPYPPTPPAVHSPYREMARKAKQEARRQALQRAPGGSSRSVTRSSSSRRASAASSGSAAAAGAGATAGAGSGAAAKPGAKHSAASGGKPRRRAGQQKRRVAGTAASSRRLSEGGGDALTSARVAGSRRRAEAAAIARPPVYKLAPATPDLQPQLQPKRASSGRRLVRRVSSARQQQQQQQRAAASKPQAKAKPAVARAVARSAARVPPAPVSRTTAALAEPALPPASAAEDRFAALQRIQAQQQASLAQAQRARQQQQKQRSTRSARRGVAADAGVATGGGSVGAVSAAGFTPILVGARRGAPYPARTSSDSRIPLPGGQHAATRHTSGRGGVGSAGSRLRAPGVGMAVPPPGGDHVATGAPVFGAKGVGRGLVRTSSGRLVATAGDQANKLQQTGMSVLERR